MGVKEFFEVAKQELATNSPLVVVFVVALGSIVGLNKYFVKKLELNFRESVKIIEKESNALAKSQQKIIASLEKTIKDLTSKLSK